MAFLDAYPTLYSKFILFYLGFFGVTLIINPSIHAADGPMPSPMAYWTTLTDANTFTFRFLGIMFMSIVLGPGLFDVSNVSFTKMTTAGNGAGFILFLYYGMYAPLDSAIAMMWKAQCFLGGAVFAWGVVATYTPLYSSPLQLYYLRFITGFFCFFGVSLVTAPAFFFGPSSPSGFVYWTEWGDVAEMTGRSLGFSILSLVGLGYYYLNTHIFLNVINVFNLINLALFFSPAYMTGEATTSVTKMWEIQMAMQVAIVIVGLNLGNLPKFAFRWVKPSGWGTDTYIFANLLFFMPFVAGFLTVPEMLFGPDAVSGIPMFIVPFNECTLWNGKAWAIGIGLTVLGPYLLGVDTATCAKQLLLGYAGNIAIFVYAITSLDIFNLTMVVPLTALNVIFLAWNAKLVYDNDKNGSSRIISSMV